MNSPELFRKTEEIQKPETPNLRNVSDSQLVYLCLENKRSAWDEFFYRFTPFIKDGIKGKLATYRRYDCVNNEDILSDIYEKIVIKLYKRNFLKYCTENPQGIRFWLKTVAQNQTIDWLREKWRNKRLSEEDSAKHTVSFEEPLSSETNLTVGDTIADKTDSYVDIREEVGDIETLLSGIKDEEKFWIFRLSILLELPLTDEDRGRLAAFSGRSLNALNELLGRAINKLEEREAKRQEWLGTAVILWHQIQRLESQVREKAKSQSHFDNQDIEILKKRILDKSKRRETLLEKGQKPCRPSNKEIAEIIGWPEGKADQISVVLLRVRKVLQQFVEEKKY